MSASGAGVLRWRRSGGAADRRIRAEAAAAWMLECVTVRPVRDDFAYVDIRLPQVHLTGIEARRGHSGAVTLRGPTRMDGNGRRQPIFALQPGVTEAAAEAVAALWQRADQAGRR